MEKATVDDKLVKRIAQGLGLGFEQVKNTILLLVGGATIPFISRYRKEMTGSLDEVQIGMIAAEFQSLTELEKRKVTILKTISEQGNLTDELEQLILDTYESAKLEDIYLPYKPKKRTRATIARERGLEPLAKIIMAQHENNLDKRAAQFVSDEVQSADDALAGARDIIAEWVNENGRARDIIRQIFRRNAFIESKVVKGKEAEGQKYRDYFDWSEPLRKCASHRFLAIKRAEKDGLLKVGLVVNDLDAIDRLSQLFVRAYGPCALHVELAVKDAYKRLLSSSIETEFFQEFKEKSDMEAIKVFGENLRQLLLSPPLGQKRVLAIDPGFQSGCKLVCLDEQGNLVHNENIYPHPPQRDVRDAAKKLSSLVGAYKIEAIAIGNGTAGRETEQFIKYMRFDREVKVFMVNEDGASVYSASKIARDEFPKYDVTVRGAVSIGRRLMDPLAELVKIEPKSIGVGQYQHDVDQKKLQESLDKVIESCVNLVGVNLNTASKHLLTYISGLGPQLAQNIVDYRKEHGAFERRAQLMDVPRMGPKAFEQAAGFLRIPGAQNRLDNSAVHPESYHIVEKMAGNLACTIEQLMDDATLRAQIKLEQYLTANVGLPTLNDIVKELAKPGLDPRQSVKVMEFDENLKTIGDLKTGMTVNGIVTNITRFGAFVDIGIKENGLVHVSEMADEYIDDPAKVVKINQHVRVKVVDVDVVRKRIQLSIKQADQ